MSIKSLTIIMAILASGCGSKDNASDPVNTVNPVNTKSPVANVNKPEAMLVEAGAPLPGCEAANKDQLIYVLDQKEFEACDGASWQVINIAGKDGATGKDGVAGKDGDNGKDGVDGKDGVNGKDAPAVASNEWYNPTTGKYWIRLGKGGTCTNGWVESNDMGTAVKQGLGTALPSADGFGAALNSNTYYNMTTGDFSFKTVGYVYVTYCVQK